MDDFTEFNMKKISKTSSILIISPRRTGKTTLCKEIMKNLNCVKNIIFNHNNDNEYIEDETTNVYNNFDTKILNSLFQTQSLESEMNNKIDEKCVVIDDCYIEKISEELMELILNGQHYKIPFIYTTQTTPLLKPEYRTNFDYIILLKNDYLRQINQIYNQYVGMFDTFDDFYKVFKQLTENYGAMIISNCSNNVDNIKDRIFWHNITLNVNDNINENIEFNEDELIKQFGIIQFDKNENANH